MPKYCIRCQSHSLSLGFDTDEVNNILPTEYEKVLLDLVGFAFESSPTCVQSEHLSDKFFCTQATKTVVDQSSVDDATPPTIADLKKDIDGLKAHADEKFKEIFEAFGDLNNKLDVI